MRFLSCLFLLSACWAQPRRIVSTAPSATEILFALGLGDRVVGVTTYCDYPPEATKKTKIGTYLQPNFELMLSLKPELVVVVKNPVKFAERMQAVGMKTLELAEETIPGIAESIRRVGDAAGVPDRATRLNRQISDGLAAIRQRTSSRPKRRVMLIIARSPGRIGGLMAAGRESFMNELIAAAGGENVFADAPGSYPKVSLEEVLARNPEVIIDMGQMAETANASEQMAAVVAAWREIGSLRAARDGRVFVVPSDVFVVAGPRVVEAADQLARMLHPDLFPASQK